MIDQPLLLKRAEEYDPKVISPLLQNSELREKFFVKTGGAFVFKTNDFRFFVEENKIDNTYTQYKNRIGLACNARLFRDNEDVVLNFPYKDCVLQGGQSTEEGKDTYYAYEKGAYQQKKEKRKEIFLNSILAHEEIDRLFDPKAFVNWKKYTGDHKTSVAKIQRSKDGTIRENLIIKGNNLPALHCLKSQFAGKIKLVYIDPPYNTGGKANIFTYNNNFNHSAWLVFMKNRLEIAAQMLREDGFIAIAIDHYELGYLVVLGDEIFGRDNRLGIISVVHKPEGRQFAKGINPTNEFMLLYCKERSRAHLITAPLDEEKILEFDEEDEHGKFKWIDYIRLGGGDDNLRANKPDNWYPVYVAPDLSKISLVKKHGWCEVLPVTNKGVERTWNTLEETLLENINLGEAKAAKRDGKIMILRKSRASQIIKTHWDKPRYNATRYGTRVLNKIVGAKKFSYPKSLYTVMDALKVTTEKDDIILDFFAGSGTTAHAILALNKEDGGNRKFILVEQIEKHISVCIERNQKVLLQEKIDNSFVYCELARWNEAAADKIRSCANLKDLNALFDELEKTYFLNYNLKIKEFKENVISDERFARLPLDQQKSMFVAMLDNNQMYVNRSEMADKKFKIATSDQSLTRKFYNEQEV